VNEGVLDGENEEEDEANEIEEGRSGNKSGLMSDSKRGKRGLGGGGL
jgi:hypothetical protein